jgi:uncharacterized phage protein gp47/JayE
MSTFDLDESVKPLTSDEIKESIYSVLAKTGTTTTNWKPGAVTRTLIAAIAIVLAALSSLVMLLARSGFIAWASSLWLSLTASYSFGTDRTAATFAAGSVTLNNSSGSTHTIGVDGLTVANTVTGKTYRNTNAFVLNPLQTGLVVPIKAVEAGSASSALPGEVATMITPLSGVTCSNAAGLVGSDEESDAALRTRAQAKLQPTSPNGPRDAYRYAAEVLTIRADGSQICNRTRVIKDGVGGVDVYVGGPGGAIPGTQDDIDTELGIIHDSIQINAFSLGVSGQRTHSAIEVAIPITYRIWMYNTPALTEQQIKDAIERELIAFMADEPIGGNYVDNVSPGKIYRDALQAAVTRAHTEAGAHLGIFRTILVEPSTDIELDPHEVPVLGSIVPASIIQIPPPGSV